MPTYLSVQYFSVESMGWFFAELRAERKRFYHCPFHDDHPKHEVAIFEIVECDVVIPFVLTITSHGSNQTSNDWFFRSVFAHDAKHHCCPGCQSFLAWNSHL